MLPINGRINGPAYTWPEGKTCAVMLTFDFDAQYLRKARAESKGSTMGFTDLSRGEYALHEGLWRVLECLDRHAVKATFFIPGIVIERYPAPCREIVRRGHEVAAHTYAHELHYEQSAEDAAKDLDKEEALIASLTGKTPRGFRGPLAQVDKATLALLKQRGYRYESTLKDCDWAYPLDDSDVVELPNEPTMDDATYWYFTFSNPANRSMYPAQEVFDVWKAEFDGLAKERNKIFVLKLHPQLIGRASRIAPLGAFIDELKARGAWIATCEEVAAYVLAHKEAYHG